MERTADSRAATRQEKIHSAEPSPETSTCGANEAEVLADQAPEHSLSEADAHHAIHLRQTTAAIYLGAASSTLLREVGANAYAAYMRGILADSGAPTDPIEQQMIEQMTMAHHAIGRMYYKASAAESPEAAGIFLTAAARLMAEHRKTALALRTYRSGVATTQVTVTQSQDGSERGPRIAILAEGVGCEVNSNGSRQGQIEEVPRGRSARTA